MLSLLILFQFAFSQSLEASTTFETINVQEENYISFDLLNKSAKSIPLFIPGVMNPNLSPFSSSGVTLKMGQKIFFKYKGRKHLLLEVDGRLMDQKLEVASLIKKRKKDLDL
jgi:hypothetical protein